MKRERDPIRLVLSDEFSIHILFLVILRKWRECEVLDVELKLKLQRAEEELERLFIAVVFKAFESNPKRDDIFHLLSFDI